MTNYYQCLGVTSNASSEQVKTAYKEFAKNFHPDKHNNSDFFKQRFQEIQQAYEVLADSAKRKVYDLKLAKQVIVDDTKIKELNLKVFKLEATIKQKDDSVTNLLAIITKKDAELKTTTNKVSDYLNQIRVLSEFIEAEKERIRRKQNPFRVLAIKFHNYAPILYVIFGLIAVVFISNIIKNNYKFNEDKIYMSKVVAMTDSLIEKKEYHMLIKNIDNLIASKKEFDAAELKGGVKPERIDLYAIRSYVYEAVGNMEAAREDIDYAIANRKEPSAYTYYRRAHLSFNTHNKEGLFNDINRAIRIDPSFIDSYALRGRAYYNIGDIGEAIKDFRKVYNVLPKDYDNLNDIGDCYYAMQKFKSACSIWKKANDLGSKEAYYSLRSKCR